MGVRNHNGVAGFPASVVPFIAAFTLAGNSTIRSAIRQIPAGERNLGNSNPAAPMNSRTPVK